jgi:hypothetical protein
MSTFDQSEPFNISDIAKQLVEFMKNYSMSEEGLEQKTNLNDGNAGLYSKVEILNSTVKSEFGVDMHFDRMVTKSLMRKKISHKGKGSSNVYGAITMQLDRLMKHKGNDSLSEMLKSGE